LPVHPNHAILATPKVTAFGRTVWPASTASLENPSQKDVGAYLNQGYVPVRNGVLPQENLISHVLRKVVG